MPEICRFYGIIIRMYFSPMEHNPPHFHAYYGDCEASFNIQTLNIIDGKLPAKARLLVMEWAIMHQSELLAIWETQKFKSLAPLE